LLHLLLLLLLLLIVLLLLQVYKPGHKALEKTELKRELRR